MSLATMRKKLGLPAGVSNPPTNLFTVLKRCRCNDCPHWVEARRIKQHYCRALIPTAAEPTQWHWCAGYGGPAISKETLVWKYSKTA